MTPTTTRCSLLEMRLRMQCGAHFRREAPTPFMSRHMLLRSASTGLVGTRSEGSYSETCGRSRKVQAPEQRGTHGTARHSFRGLRIRNKEQRRIHNAEQSLYP